MSSVAEKIDITITDEVDDLNEIKMIDSNTWHVTQKGCNSGEGDYQYPTWVKIDNKSSKAEITLTIKWTAPFLMNYRKISYLMHDGEYFLVTGEISTTETEYKLDVPEGVSYFGPAPWYSLEDEENFLAEMLEKSSYCKLRILGKSNEGHDIKCLTISKDNVNDPEEVLVTGRMHGTEPSGSLGVEGGVRWLLDEENLSLLDKYRFHFIVICSPDGVAHGSKLTQEGPMEEYDMLYAGINGTDPSIKALRDEIMSMKPAVYLDHHAYLFSKPFIGTFRKKVGLEALAELVPEDENISSSWLWRKTEPEVNFLRYKMYADFNTTVLLTELPWQGHMPDDIRQQGADTLRAALKAHEKIKVSH
jgi:hypothetical protein